MVWWDNRYHAVWLSILYSAHLETGNRCIVRTPTQKICLLEMYLAMPDARVLLYLSFVMRRDAETKHRLATGIVRQRAQSVQHWGKDAARFRPRPVFLRSHSICGNFSHTPDGTGLYTYNALLYANNSVTYGDHSFTVQNGRAGGSPSLILFDYLMYTRYVLFS